MGCKLEIRKSQPARHAPESVTSAQTKNSSNLIDLAPHLLPVQLDLEFAPQLLQSVQSPHVQALIRTGRPGLTAKRPCAHVLKIQPVLVCTRRRCHAVSFKPSSLCRGRGGECCGHACSERTSVRTGQRPSSVTVFVCFVTLCTACIMKQSVGKGRRIQIGSSSRSEAAKDTHPVCARHDMWRLGFPSARREARGARMGGALHYNVQN